MSATTSTGRGPPRTRGPRPVEVVLPPPGVTTAAASSTDGLPPPLEQDAHIHPFSQRQHSDHIVG